MTNATGKYVVLFSWIATGCAGNAAAPAASTPDQAAKAAQAAATPVTKHGKASVTAHVGPAGGTLELDEGPRVQVPAGAVSEPKDFVLKVAPMTTAFSNREGEKTVGPTFAFAPAVQAPEGESIEISFPMGSMPEGWGEPSIAYEKPEGEKISYGEDSTRTRWFYEQAHVSDGRIIADLPNTDGLRLQFTISNLEVQ